MAWSIKSDKGYPYGALDIRKDSASSFKVNVQRLKQYMGKREEVKELADINLDEVRGNQRIASCRNVKSSVVMGGNP